MAIGAAWSVPAITVAAAAPVFAASPASPACLTAAQFSFTVTQQGPSTGPTGTYLLTSGMTMGVFTSTFTNTGSTVPAGTATIQLDSPYGVDNATVFGYLYETVAVTSVTPGFTLTQTATNMWGPVSDGSHWYGYRYTVDQAIPAGAVVEVGWTMTAFDDVVSSPLARAEGGGTTDYATYSLSAIETQTCAGSTKSLEGSGPTYYLRTPDTPAP